MLHAFVDESESKTDYYFLSALILDDEGLSALNTRLANLLAEETIADHLAGVEELHGYEMMQQKDDWKGVPFRLATNIYRRALTIINECRLALYIEGIDRNRLSRKYDRPYDPRDLAISYTFERINEFSQRNGDTASVYLDDHHTADEARRNFVAQQQNGTLDFKSSKLEQIHSFDFFDSKEYWGL